ncbi:MAG: DNA polymerase III subunit delta [Lachnospiraceae bacterium]|nr:DNA polymerase III subunit delta [Lachnospiraceae bacterium]
MKKLKADIKNRDFKNCYLFYGEEDYLKRIYRDSFKESVMAGGDDMNFTRFEGKETDVIQVTDLADTLPFFSDYRLLILENTGFFNSANDLADYLPKMPDTTIMLFVEKEVDKRNRLYKYINKSGHVVEMKSMSAKDMKLWVVGLLNSEGKKIRESTVEYFLGLIDNSMHHIKNELDKLIAYVGEREEITKEDVDAIACVQVNGQIFQMMDAVASGNKKLTMKLYSDLLELRESPMVILSLLSRHFNILLQIKALGDGAGRSEIAAKVKIRPFFVGRYQSQAKHFSEKQLRKMLEMCAETEYLFKRGRIGDRIGVELLLVQFVERTA